MGSTPKMLLRVLWHVLDLKSISNGSCKAQNFERCLVCNGFHSKRARICYPKVGKGLFGVCQIQNINGYQKPKNWKREKKTNLNMQAITLILVDKPLPRALRKYTMSNISTHLCCTMSCQNFLVEPKSWWKKRKIEINK